MRIEDRHEFNTLLITAMAVYERQITAALGDLFFAALSAYTMDQVRDGIARHLQDPADGKFSPKPADVIRQIQNVRSHDGRPGKDEAWSIALCSLDETDTVLLTEEILTALAVAQPLLDMRDKVAARMAFIEVYERQVSMVRRGPWQSAKWIISLGTDKGRRIHAVEEGVRLGRLTEQQAAPHLERISQETQRISVEGSVIAGLIAGPAGATEEEIRERNRERLQGIRNLVGPGARNIQAEKSMADALAKRADTERRKRVQEHKIQGKRADDIIPDEFE